MAVTGFIVTALATGYSISEQRKAQRKQDKADRLTRAQTNIENQRRIKQEAERARLARAAMIAQGTEGGVGESTAVAGGIGSAITQEGANAGFARQAAGANRRSNQLIGSANRSLNNAQVGQSVAGLSSQLGFGGAKDAVNQIKGAKKAGANPFGFGYFHNTG